jgi:hypothetical protein
MIKNLNTYHYHHHHHHRYNHNQVTCNPMGTIRNSFDEDDDRDLISAIQIIQGSNTKISDLNTIKEINEEN